MFKKLAVVVLFFLLSLLSSCKVSQPSISVQENMTTPTLISEESTQVLSNSTNIAPTSNSDQEKIIVFGEGYGEGFVYQKIDEPVFFNFNNEDHFFDLIVRDNSGNNLLGLSLNGYVQIDNCLNEQDWVYIFLKPEIDNDKWLFPPLISPDNQKVAYFLGNGQLFEGMLTSNYEKQDLVIRNTKTGDVEIKLTQNGGARQVISTRFADLLSIWSPNSEWIVNSDYDSKGIYQLYLSRIDGNEKHQITNRSIQNEDPLIFHYSVDWAPSGDFLAISYFDEIIITKIISMNNKTDITLFNNSFPLWWTNENQLLIKDVSGNNIKLFNPITTQTSKLIDEFDYPLSMIEPFGDPNKIGFFVYQSANPMNSHFYVFDIQTKKLEFKPSIKLPSEKTKYWLLINSPVKCLITE